MEAVPDALRVPHELTDDPARARAFLAEALARGHEGIVAKGSYADMIAVSGDPLRTNAYAFAHNGMLGYPTTKPVRLPPDWPRRLREARSR